MDQGPYQGTGVCVCVHRLGGGGGGGNGGGGGGGGNGGGGGGGGGGGTGGALSVPAIKLDLTVRGADWQHICIAASLQGQLFTSLFL